MLTNIYENTSWTFSKKFCKGSAEDGGQREEQLVDIYDSVGPEALREQGATSPTHPPGVQRKLLQAAALLLTPLCLLLAAAVIFLYRHLVSSNNQSSIRYEEVKNKYDNLSRGYCRSEGPHNQTWGNATEWKLFKISCYYKSTVMKSWKESREDCRARAADLLVIDDREENEFAKKLNGAEASWIGLQSVRKDVKKEWESKREWEWVDKSPSAFRSWMNDVKYTPEEELKAFINPEGTWGETNTGSKRWICEKRIH